jgi:hypothetical protein
MSDPDTSPAPETWPAGLDALVAAPGHRTLLFESDPVGVLETRVRPGERTPVHTHRWPGVLRVLQWSPFVRRDAAGRTLLESRANPELDPPPAVLWPQALPPHSLENVGAGDIRVVSVGLKRAAS